MSIITLTSDFGTGSAYVAAMKGVILSINPAVTLVDITHAIPPQNVSQAALILDDVAERFPDETIHVVVVDPGVGTGRAILCARIGKQHFIAPDNGVLSRLAKRTPPSQIVRLENDQYWLTPVSATFHGRDIMAPVAARLSLGLDPERLGPPATGLVELDWPEIRVAEDAIDGIVIQIDSFGNLVTNIRAKLLADRPRDQRMTVVCKGWQTRGIVRTYGDRRSGNLVALIGSSGRLEVAVVDGSAAKVLDARLGDRVTLRWDAT